LKDTVNMLFYMWHFLPQHREASSTTIICWHGKHSKSWQYSHYNRECKWKSGASISLLEVFDSLPSVWYYL
jgi:hypothetical protein